MHNNNLDLQYSNLLKNILKNGEVYTDKSRDVNRVQTPSATIRHEMEEGFPLITSKETDLNCIAHELIWFLNGDTNVVSLVKNDVNIWNKDAYNEYKRSMYGFYGYMLFLNFKDFVKCLKMLAGKEQYPQAIEDYLHSCIESHYNLTDSDFGCVGKNYSYQWRKSNGWFDQIENCIKLLKEDRYNTRNILEAWSPTEIDETALPPCHKGFQIIGVKEGFELHWNQRSVDTFLGLPFNIASYALLGLFLEKSTGVKFIALQGDLKNVHLYENQIEPAMLQISRGSFELPTVKVNIMPDSNLYLINREDISLINYKHFEKIKVKMLAPKN